MREEMASELIMEEEMATRRILSEEWMTARIMSAPRLSMTAVRNMEEMKTA